MPARTTSQGTKYRPSRADSSVTTRLGETFFNGPGTVSYGLAPVFRRSFNRRECFASEFRRSGRWDLSRTVWAGESRSSSAIQLSR